MGEGLDNLSLSEDQEESDDSPTNAKSNRGQAKTVLKQAPPVKKMGRDVEMERVKIKTEIERVRRYKEVA